MKQHIVLFATTLLLSAPVWAQEEGSVLELSGTTTGEIHAPLDPDNWNFNGEIKKPRVDNEVGFTMKSGEIKVVSKWNLITSPGLDGTILNSVETNENAIYWNPDKLKVGMGWQYYAWGTADNKNPTDNLNPRDYRYSVNPEIKKLPVFSLAATWYPTDSLSVQEVYIPVRQQSLFPVNFQAGVSSGLAQFSSAASSKGFLFNPATVSTTTPGWTPANGISGTRISWRSEGLDASVSYVYDWDQFFSPEIALTSVTNSMAPVSMSIPGSVNLKKTRVHRFGADAKTIVDRFGLWAEAVYNQTENWSPSKSSGIRNPSFDYTLGIDTNFGPQDTFYANLQYYGEVIVDYDRNFGSSYTNGQPDSTQISNASYMQEYYYRSMTQSLGLQTQGVTQGITFNVKTPLFEDQITPSLNGAFQVPLNYDDTNVTRFGSLAVKPQLDLMPVDSFHIKVGLELYYAWIKAKGDSSVKLDTTSDAIGTYTPGNNLYLLVSYAWNYQLKK